ncbi:hypothetical protein D3C73_1295620 [compost metagenome]
MDRISKALGRLQIRRGGFAPHQVSVRAICQATADRLLDTGMGAEETFGSALTGHKLAVVRVAVRGQ